MMSVVVLSNRMHSGNVAPVGLQEFSMYISCFTPGSALLRGFSASSPRQ
jgi:hypothetical protein